MIVKMTYDKATAIRIRDYLLSQGLTLEGTYGMMANIYTESGFRSNNAQNSYMSKMGMTDEEYTTKVDSGEYTNFVFDKVGYGLAQWTSSGRKQGIFNYAKSLNKSIGDENMQLDYLMIELTTAYKSVLNFLKSSHDIRESAKYVMTKFERPADQSESAQNKRADYGEQLYEDLENVKGSDKMSKVAIDAGHGSQTAGKRTPNGYKEHWINVKTAYYCEQYLQSKGIETVRIGWNDTNATDDVDISLSTRQKQIKNAKCDYSVSCHANAYGNGSTYNSADGVSTHIHSNGSYLNDSIKFGQAIQNRLVEGTKQRDRGVIRQSLAMCNCKTMGTKASCLVEIAFMTNKKEADLMMTEEFCKEQGEDIAKGICDYLGIDVSNNVVSTPSPTLSINQFAPLKGNPTYFAEIIKNIKLALNTDYGLAFTIDSGINDILLVNLANVVLSTSAYKPNITYALQQLFVWWGYDLILDGIYGNGTQSTVSLFQSQARIPQTGTTTKEFWYKILGR